MDERRKSLHMIRDHVLRVIAVGLVLYGLLGFVLLAFGYVVASQTLAQLDALRDSVVGQRDALVGVLRSTSQTVGDASTALANLDQSLDQALQAAQSAAGLARGLSQTMADLGRAMQVPVLGVQPLLPLADGFRRASEQFTTFAGDLDGTSRALGQNGSDLRRAGSNLAEVRRHLEGLAQAFETTPLLGGPIEALRLIKIAIYGLLIWLSGQALVSVLLGIYLFRHAHGRLRAR